ncbi:TlpA disulfide reductase family protein [Sinomonas sp. ASV322]|uniref:TlpA family protein disulfide reductase n=1 Tax=Sinomonas sp. ASV322 TaxID=3041920 RepID=UPI0027DDB475|nr:TlpA disulfide reductase family protein [Sinomonas sp. ASV322]MDQ4503751.1 TlpA disulfide reductase family protein [Sinomonas sp. ASV322]
MASPVHPSRRRILAFAVALPIALGGLSACAANDPLAQQARAGDNKNYVAGDGSVTEYAKDQRKPPVAFTGTLYDGKTVGSASFAGHVTVLNFWFASCAPCRVEAPSLKQLHDEFAPQGVVFYGVNLRDEKGTAEAFEQNFGITYPSFNDQDGRVLLAVSGMVPPGAVPTTLVLDKQGRVSARILGELDKGTLKALIESAAAE